MDMKKYSALSLGLATAILMASCAKQGMPETGTFTKIYAVSAEQQDSKTSLNGTNVLWSQGDQIDIISNGGGKAATIFTLTGGAGTNQGEFTGSHASSSAPFFYIYPFRAGNNKGGGTLNVEIPQIQYYAENTFGAGANPMVAMTADKPASPTGEQKVEFKNLFGALRLAIKGKVHVTKIELTDLSGAMIYGTAKCGIATGGKALTMTYTMTDGGNSVILNCGDGVTLKEDAPTYFHICLPDGALKSGCTLKFFDGVNVINTVTTSKAHAIVRSQITAIAPFVLEQGESGETVVTDLSEEGTANCYILYEAGAYKFKTVKGNTTTALDAASAAILWESVNTATAPSVGALVSDASYADGYITFNATGVKGNALIAAKNSDGKIIWSWHIWIPETKITKAAYSNGKVAAFMDRNLGAINATPGDTKSIGLFYQWGRKDPFMGMCSFTANTAAKATAEFEFVPTDTDVETATANPTTYYSDKSQVHGSSRDWDTARDIKKWTKPKTVYDPCPAGYRTPENIYWDNITDTKYDAATHGWTVEGKHYYPMTGLIMANDLAYHSIVTNGYYYTCVSGTNQGQMLWNTASAFTPKKSTDRAQALAIRCCSDSIN